MAGLIARLILKASASLIETMAEHGASIKDIYVAILRSNVGKLAWFPDSTYKKIMAEIYLGLQDVLSHMTIQLLHNTF